MKGEVKVGWYESEKRAYVRIRGKFLDKLVGKSLQIERHEDRIIILLTKGEK